MLNARRGARVHLNDANAKNRCMLMERERERPEASVRTYRAECVYVGVFAAL